MLVSIVIPVYNAEEFLERSVESVLKQSCDNFELILVNDGSTDRSENILERLAQSDARITVVFQKNSGPAAARNTGVRKAAGDFIFFLDADDFISVDALKTLVNAQAQYHADLVMANFRKLENNGKIIEQGVFFWPDGEAFNGRIKELTKDEIGPYVRHFLNYPSNHLISYCWGRLYKTSIIRDNNIFADESMRLFEDFVFNLDYLKRCNKTVFVNEPLYTYTMHNQYISASMAVINSESLTHDLEIFKSRGEEFFRGAYNIVSEISHTVIHYLIIFLTRTSMQINSRNKDKIYGEIKKICRARIIRESLPYYAPKKGNSRILPLLIRFNLAGLIMLLCSYKARKRYGVLKH